MSLPETAGQILERMLNERDASSGESARFEVLNFGTSNHGIGRYLLPCEECLRQFAPDYGFVLASGLHFSRTGNALERGLARASGVELALGIRPTFALAVTSS